MAALRHLRPLHAYPDAAVQRAVRAAETDIEGLPVALNDYLAAMAPAGMELARFDLSLRLVPPTAESGSRGYAFRRPVRLRVVRDGEYFLAYSPAFLVHATGDTPEAALWTYCAEWAANYRELVALAAQQRLGGPLRRELAGIRRRLRQPEVVLLPPTDSAEIEA